MEFYNDRGRRIGKLEQRNGEMWLVKRVKRDKHMLRQPYGAWATDAEHIPLLRKAGAAGIVLIVDGGKQVLYSRLERWEDKSFPVRRWGNQVALMGSEWRERDEAQGVLPL